MWSIQEQAKSHYKIRSLVPRADCLRDEHSFVQDCALPCLVQAMAAYASTSVILAPAQVHRHWLLRAATHAETLAAAWTKESRHGDRTCAGSNWSAQQTESGTPAIQELTSSPSVQCSPPVRCHPVLVIWESRIQTPRAPVTLRVRPEATPFAATGWR